jgi:hypothetical protein
MNFKQILHIIYILINLFFLQSQHCLMSDFKNGIKITISDIEFL